MKIVQKYGINIIFMMMFQSLSMQASQDLQRSEIFEKNLDMYEKLGPDCVEGFNILRSQGMLIEGQEIPTYRDFLKKNLIGEDEKLDEESNFGDVHTQALELICDQMKLPFYSLLLEESKKVSSTIDEIKDPIFCYVMNHLSGYMALSVKNIINITDDKQFLPPLLYAIFSGNLNLVKLLFDIGADLNIKVDTMHCSLSAAIIRNKFEVVEFLIHNGADVNIQDGSRFSPLSHAVIYNHLDIMNLLIQHGADIHYRIKNHFDSTLLYLAAVKNSIACAERLIDLGLDVNAVDKRGSTPLCVAAMFGHAEVAQLLIDHKADVNLFVGCKLFVPGVIVTMEEVIKNGDKAFSKSPLLFAVEKKHDNVVEILLQAGANPNIKTSFQDYPLHDAAEQGNYKVVELLLQSGANPNIKNGRGLTVLHNAVKGNHVEIVKLLMSSGADVKLVDSLKRTPEQFSQQIATRFSKVKPWLHLVEKLDAAKSDEEEFLLLKNHDEKFNFLDDENISIEKKAERVAETFNNFFWKEENNVQINDNISSQVRVMRSLEQAERQAEMDNLFDRVRLVEQIKILFLSIGTVVPLVILVYLVTHS